ncbi:hypothetical protein DL93DRAFT_1987612 [Clavulina sp. PMI_390]|nr:hypothetical protein DL93DRAFT_1987612 [Clavulina sp. PMI_390]
MSIDPIVLQTFIDAHSALADNIKQLPVQPHILSLNPLRRAEFRNSINRASSQLEDLAVHLGSAGALLANDIKRSRDQLRLCIAPIGYLPAEVFRSIIRLLISSQPASQRPQAVRTLLAVSVRWRDIVQSDAFLFTFIDWNKWNAKIIAIWRARADKYPLSITLDARWVPLFTTSWPLRGGGHSLAFYQDLAGSHQRVDAAQLAQSTLLDELAAALGKSCKALCLEWDHASAFYGFESWVKQRDIVLYDVEALASKVPEILHSSFQVKRLPSLRRLGAVHPISFSRGSPAHLTQLSLTLDRGKWSSYATSISRLPSLELLRIRLGQNSLQLDSWPQIILFQLNTFELCDCWSGEFMKNVIPSFNTPNVYELVLDSNQYLNRAWWRIWRSKHSPM